MIEHSETRDGVRFTVKVVPRASRNEIVGSQEGILRVRLTAPPVEGAANKALIALLSGRLRIPKRDIEIVAGHTSRKKVVYVGGLSAREVSTRLAGHTSSR